MVLEKSWVSGNFRRVSKSRLSKLESRNLELAKNNARLGIWNFEIESPSLANQAKVLISLNRHKNSLALGFLNHGVSGSDLKKIVSHGLGF